MNILQVIHGYLPQFRGGTELYLRGLTRELRRREQDVTIFAGTTHSADEARVEHYDFDGHQVAQLVLAGSYLEHWTRGYSADAARLFAEELRRIRPDVVHIHHWFRLTRNLLETCYRLGIPAVCTLHDLYATCPSFFRVVEGSFVEAPLDDPLWVEALPRLPWMSDDEVRDEIVRFRADFANEMRLAHRIIVPSAAHGRVVSRLLELPEERLVVLPHGTITPPPPEEQEILEVPGPEDRIRLGYWGHLFHMKGPHLLLEAVKASGQADRFELHVWGKVVEPQYRERLRRAAEGLDVRWYGAFVPEDIEKVPLDCAVIPSSCSESYSFVLDEAFRLDLPAIVSDRGALAERLQGAGTTFRPESVEDLARVLKDLAANPAVIGTWREKVPALASMEEHAGEVLELYADVLRKRDMSRLVPDLDLPRRRTEALARRLREREGLMFSYLGRIKRESGRGDHYEGVVEEMIAKEHELGARANHAEAELATMRRVAAERARLIEVMGREIADLREALAQPPGVPARPVPLVPEIEEHVPGLGSVAAIVQENQAALQRFSERQESTASGQRDQTLEFLTGELLALREAAERALAGEVNFEIEGPEIPADPMDLPRLGDPATIAADDSEIIDRLRGSLLHVQAENPMTPEEEAARREAEERALDTRIAEVEAEAERRIAEVEGLRGESEAQFQVEREALLKFWGQSIEELRRLVLVVHEESPELPSELGEATPEQAADLPHVPGLGDIATLRRVNAELAQDYVARLRELRGRLAEERRERDTGEQKVIELGQETESLRGVQRGVLTGLSREVELLRRALSQVAHPRADFAMPERVPLPEGVNVEGLGTLEQIREADEAMVEEYLAVLRRLRKTWI